MRYPISTLVLVSLFAAALTAAHPAGAQDIHVVVNQVPVSFAGSPPKEVNGSVLVPLRGVFEQLGASVDYNASTQQIQSKKGTTLVVLTIGQTTAYVDGVPQNLSQPAQVINGTTLVPLRFVAQSFGADVAWLPSSQTVEINTTDQHLANLPSPTLNASGVVVGTLTGVYQSTNPPQITLRVNGQNNSVPVNENTLVLIQEGDQPATQRTLNDLSIGDQVRVTEPSRGQPAALIRVTYGELTGTLKSVTSLPDGSAVVTLNDGQSRQVASDAKITMAGRPVKLSDILPSERVIVRTDPQTKIAYSVTAPAGNPNAQPDMPSTATNAGPVTISSFSVDSDHPLKSGDTIQATLRGTPGQTAVVTIPGIVDKVKLAETEPGVYRGKIPMPSGANIEAGSVLAQLIGQGGSDQSPLIQAAQTVTIDTKPPKISGESPSPDSTVANNRPQIYAVMDDANGSGVNSKQTSISVDGHDVTSRAIVTAGFVTFQPSEPLAKGVHSVNVTTADAVGNTAQKTWSFTVSPNQGLINSVTSNIDNSNHTLIGGQPLNVTMHAQPGGSGSFSVGSIAKNIPMTESTPGVYTGTYLPAAGSSIQNAPVVTRLTASDGTIVTSTLDQPVTINAGAPTTPKVLNPVDNQAVGDTLTVTGTAAPGATVNVSITYKAKALGGLFSMNGKAADAQAVTDQHGNWTTQALTLASPGVLASTNGETFELTATTVDADGKASDPVTVDFRHG